MAIGIIFEPDVDQEKYDRVVHELYPDGRPADGMLLHAAGPSEQGWRVIEVWESQEAATRYFNDKLRASMERAGIHAQPLFFQVHNMLTA